MSSILETLPQNKGLKEFPPVNSPACAAERRARPHEGRSVLPADEASDGQRQLQTVRPHRGSLCTQAKEQSARLESVFACCRESCQRGWRLLYILTAYHRCSDVLRPFLLQFLQEACESPTMQYQGRRFARFSSRRSSSVPDAKS